ncbi:MAG: hypothetical protein IJH81_11335 [Lachnospiraceae bacterium]|nr:hypothetical protein [Lachnospiraceae bacterium]
MELSTVLQDTQKAFENNECYELLTGQKGYALPVPDLPIPVPTDWSRVIPHGIHKLFRETKDETIPAQYERAIGRLITEGGESVWIASYVLFTQLSQEYKGKASFLLHRSIFPLFHEAVKKNRDFLEQHQSGWGGMTCFEDIVRLNQILWEDYGITMLPSEVVNND